MSFSTPTKGAVRLQQTQPPFLAFTLSRADYLKLHQNLPIPSYKQNLTSIKGDKVLIAYFFSHPIITARQWAWLGSVKQGLKELNAELIDELIVDITKINLATYSLAELSKTFKSPSIVLPKLYFTMDKKELYGRLKAYSIRLLRKDLLSFEYLIAGAIKLNDNITKHNANIQAFSNRELQKKAKSLIAYLNKNQDKYLVDKDKLQSQLRKGGVMRAKQKKQEAKINQQRVKELVNEYKAKGLRVNKTSIAEALGLSRQAIYNILTALGASCFLFIPSDLLEMLHYTQQAI